jgi:hypothetical protein
MDLSELMELEEIQNRQNKMLSEPDKDDKFSYSQVRVRTAKLNKEIDTLWKSGSSTCEISHILAPLNVSPNFIKVELRN